jgi:hypothetical protein
LKKIDGKRRQEKKKSQLFRPKVFDMGFPQKVFCGVFELPLLRSAKKTPLKKSQKLKQTKKAPTYPI